MDSLAFSWYFAKITMSATQPTGAYEARYWSSKVNPHRSGDISVFVPFAPRAPDGIDAAAMLAEAEHALVTLNTNTTAQRMTRTLAAVEAIASSAFEGVSRPTARVFDASTAGGAEDVPTQQILANIQGMQEAMQPVEPMISHEVLHGWHKRIIGPRLPSDHIAGEYRRTQNWIGFWGSTPLNATFVPPPPELIGPLMDDLVGFANVRTLSSIVHAAIAHAHFETIHPYGDGNGRVGRLLIYRILSSRGATALAPPPISPGLNHGRDVYIAGLTAYREGHPDAWVAAFAQLLADACHYGILLALSVEALERKWTEQVRDTRSGSVDHKIVPSLINGPVLDAPRVSTMFGVTTTAARDALRRLAEHGIVTERELRRGRRGRPAKVFEATEFIELLDETPQVLAARLQREQ